MRSIYTITSINVKPGRFGEEVRSQRCFGFTFEKEGAFERVRENRGDIQELLYEYCVIEEYEEGIQSLSETVQWFKWVETPETHGSQMMGHWKECKVPSFALSSYNWAF